MAELDKLEPPEREEFLHLWRTPPHELTEEMAARFQTFLSKIDLHKFADETLPAPEEMPRMPIDPSRRMPWPLSPEHDLGSLPVGTWGRKTNP